MLYRAAMLSSEDIEAIRSAAMNDAELTDHTGEDHRQPDAWIWSRVFGTARTATPDELEACIEHYQNGYADYW